MGDETKTGSSQIRSGAKDLFRIAVFSKFAKENQEISRFILKIYADCDKRLGAYKITHLLQRDYGINISVGRVYRLMKILKLPRMSTDKPFLRYKLSEESKECPNHLKQNFNPQAPNIVWASDFTYIKAGGKWHYLCIIMDLFSRKIIAWNIDPMEL